MIKISRFCVTYPAPEDDEDDYCPDGALEWEEHEMVSFPDLVKLMREFYEPSCYPPRGDTSEWLASRHTDWRTGDEAEITLHFSHNNQARKAKYWRLAMKAAGILKERTHADR